MEDNPIFKYDGEVYIYYGDISRVGYHILSEAFERKSGDHTKMCLILITRGGDPDAGYRIARAASHHFEEIEILIPDICKSAGTLICIGANKLIFGDRGELGPLDIQLSKPDELLENMSGLDIVQAINALQHQTLTAFRSYLFDIRVSSKIRTKMAAEIATRLADGFIAPIAARIDPMTLGEHQRATQIALDYGERLNTVQKSLKNGALHRLIASYPSHGFVIDRREARELFNNVAAPNEELLDIYNWARNLIANSKYPTYDYDLIICDVKNELTRQDLKRRENSDEDDISDRQPADQVSNEGSPGSSGPKGQDSSHNYFQPASVEGR